MKLAFCGLGLMGAPMVRRLLAAGHEVRVWNRTAAKAAPLLTLGAQPAATPAQAAAGADYDLERRLLFRFQSGQILDRCANLITRLFYSCGARGIYRSSPLVRACVDIHSGRTHVANNPGSVSRNLGAVLLGNPNTDTFI